MSSPRLRTTGLRHRARRRPERGQEQTQESSAATSTTPTSGPQIKYNNAPPPDHAELDDVIDQWRNSYWKD
jgi:hypothetical protein